MLDGLLVIHESVETDVESKHCLEDSLLNINVEGAVCGVYRVYLHRNYENNLVDAFHVDFTEMQLK